MAAFISLSVYATVTNQTQEQFVMLGSIGTLILSVALLPRTLRARELGGWEDSTRSEQADALAEQLRAVEWNCTKIRLGYVVAVAFSFFALPLILSGLA